MGEADQCDRLQPGQGQPDARRAGTSAAPERESAAADGKRRIKASSGDIRTKVVVIRANAHKYSISALCRCLGIAPSTYYYESRGREDESVLEEAVQAAYDENGRVYGQRKLKRVLLRNGWTVSRHKI